MLFGFVLLLGFNYMCDGRTNIHHQPSLPNVVDKAKLNILECGRDTNTSARIVGGVETEAHEYPWHVAISNVFWPKSTYCGGSLIAPKWVLSAAHCFYDKSLLHYIAVNTILIRLGVHYQVKQAVAEVQMIPVTMIIHKNYNNTYKRNDIALLMLPEKVTYGPTILPVCLPDSANKQYDDVIAIATGYGNIAHGVEVSPDVMMEVSLQTISHKKCTKMVGYSWITDSMLCAAHHSDGKDTCQGDSGGPLITLENGRYVQIGIVSWGYGCGEAVYPGVYTRVSKYLKWIKKNSSPNTSCQYMAKCYRNQLSSIHFGK